MNLDHIRDRLRNGFKPFQIQLTNGRTFEVPHPEFIALARNVVVVLARTGRVTIIDPLHIASIEDLKPRRKIKD